MPVIVDFWAPWCGPCKQLTPVLEKVVKAARGAVRLVKMNIDDHPEVAGQLGVQSIPAVFAFKNGQPIDGFMGALPESQVKAFIQRLLGPGAAGADEMPGLEEAKAAFDAGDVGGADSGVQGIGIDRSGAGGTHHGFPFQRHDGTKTQPAFSQCRIIESLRGVVVDMVSISFVRGQAEA